ncbi:MAG: penicillin-binding protein 2 [Kiritimatiellae bacterium]|jgi:penicillin-binding protein 2|nr:penicillin-binding protein 2 [Kiritimatiellia bacterium]
MVYRGQKLTSSWRIALLALLFAGCMVYLAMSLHRVQVVNSADLTRDQVRQSVRRVQVPGARGRIFDRNGICLADNRPSYCIAYYVEELRKRGKWQRTVDAVDADIDRLSKVIGLPREISKKRVALHVRTSLPMPLLAWRDVSEEVVARWAEEVGSFPGVDIYVQPERYYPYKTTAAHLLGYVGRDRPKPLPGQRIHFYLPEMIGKSGLEFEYNEMLTGVSGGRLIRVDARGYKNAVWEGTPAVEGDDLHLTLDIKLQLALEKALDGKKGAGVVVDPRNGEILALASAPNFDLNDFVPAPSHVTWNKLNADKALPLYNRAIQGCYAPGSTFKPVTAIAALTTGKITPDEVLHCDGVFKLGTMRLRCWNTYGHGDIVLQKAIEQSCNAFFCELGHRVGYEALRVVAADVGLGVKTGIDLPFESSGLLPTDEWKRKHMREPWRVGDTCQIAIGQSMLLTTPLQMAMLVSVLANKNSLYRPHMIARDGPGEIVREMNWPAPVIDLVRNGMHDVATKGTGRRVQIHGTEIAAKTGSAEYDSGGKRKKNTWVTAFAPFEKPTVAMAILVEDGLSGGYTVAPLIHDVMVEFFGETPVEEMDDSLNPPAVEDISD